MLRAFAGYWPSWGMGSVWPRVPIFAACPFAPYESAWVSSCMYCILIADRYWNGIICLTYFTIEITGLIARMRIVISKAGMIHASGPIS